MPYIPLKENLPGITGLLDYRKDTALPIRELTQILLRGESTLSEGERELIAAVVSHGNECAFCTAAHTAAADLLLGDNTIVHAGKFVAHCTVFSRSIYTL
jgi:AhpD family alkylhydroperoxidase